MPVIYILPSKAQTNQRNNKPSNLEGQTKQTKHEAKQTQRQNTKTHVDNNSDQSNPHSCSEKPETKSFKSNALI